MHSIEASQQGLRIERGTLILQYPLSSVIGNRNCLSEKRADFGSLDLALKTLGLAYALARSLFEECTKLPLAHTNSRLGLVYEKGEKRMPLGVSTISWP